MFDESVLPLLMQAAAKAGAETSGMSTALEVLVRDKNVALDHLSKVRHLLSVLHIHIHAEILHSSLFPFLFVYVCICLRKHRVVRLLRRTCNAKCG